MKNDKQQRHRRLFHDKFEQIERCVAAAATRPNTYLPKIASLRYDLASDCWFDDQDGVTAEEQLLAAIDACDRYTGRRRDVDALRISAIEALTFIYNQLGRLEDSERMMLLQLEAERERAAQNEEVYLENVALQLWHLGNLYVDMHRDKDAEAAYLEALELRTRFDDEDIYRYRPATAQCHRSLGNLYFSRLGNPDAAEAHYKEAVKISEELCENQYERCNHIRALAKSLRLLEAFYEQRGRHDLAEPLAERAASLEQELEVPLPFDMPAEESQS